MGGLDNILHQRLINNQADSPPAVPDEVITELAVEHLHIDSDRIPGRVYAFARALLSTAPQAVVTGWIDPNDKSQKKFLPHIGEAVLFCQDRKTYYGIHTGGSFKTGQGITARLFGTWDCLWMYPPAAAQKGGEL